MDTSRKIKMTVELEVTIPQALTLQAMFQYWNQLSGQGSSRHVSFYADGDGNFHPKTHCMFSEDIPYLSAALRQAAVVEDLDGNRKYDFDPVAWRLSEPEEFEALLKRAAEYDDDEIIHQLVADFKRQDEEGKRLLVRVIVDEIERRRREGGES